MRRNRVTTRKSHTLVEPSGNIDNKRLVGGSIGGTIYKQPIQVSCNELVNESRAQRAYLVQEKRFPSRLRRLRAIARISQFVATKLVAFEIKRTVKTTNDRSPLAGEIGVRILSHVENYVIIICAASSFVRAPKDLYLVEIANVKVIKNVTKTIFSFFSVLVLTMADEVIRKWE